MALIVRRTKGTSPAFIKELVRRSAQFQIELGAGSVLKQEAVDEAIEEMVFTGGALQFKAAGRLGNRTRGCGRRVTLQVLLSNKLGPAFRTLDKTSQLWDASRVGACENLPSRCRQRDRKNSMTASWSLRDRCSKPCVALLASPRCRRMASRKVVEAPSCINRGRRRTPHKGGVRSLFRVL